MIRLATFVVVSFLAAGSAAAEVLYAPTPIGSSARISDFGQTSNTGFRSFDNFTVVSGGTVERVTWRGFWIDFASPTPAPAPLPDALSWTLAFHADAAGSLGGALSSQSFAAAAVSATFLGTGVFNVNGSFNVSFYEYSVDLSIPFDAAAGTQYWFSAMSISDVYLPAFALQGATGGDDVSIQQQLGAGMAVVSTANVARDRAIRLEGTRNAVPEPSSALLVLLALALLGARTLAPSRR